jgi:hypothetical protein
MASLIGEKRRAKPERAVKLGRGRSVGGAKSVAVRKKQSSNDPRPPRPTFGTLDRFRARKLGMLVTVELDQGTEDFAHLIGKKIVIDGKVETCFSVDRLPHGLPLKKAKG